MNVTRIIRHNNIQIKELERFAIKIDGTTVQINSSINGLSGGPVQDLHQEIVNIFQESDLFLLESYDVNYKPGFLDKIIQKFMQYTKPELGMIYFDVIPHFIGERYTPQYVGTHIPEICVLNKKYCPGLPLQMDINLLQQLVNQAPILYIPNNEVTKVENTSNPS